LPCPSGPKSALSVHQGVVKKNYAVGAEPAGRFGHSWRDFE
jgi:hypothetical protein